MDVELGRFPITDNRIQSILYQFGWVGLLVQQNAEAAHGIGNGFGIRLTPGTQPDFVRIFRAGGQEKLFETADDHGTVFRVPGREELKGTHDR